MEKLMQCPYTGLFGMNRGGLKISYKLLKMFIGDVTKPPVRSWRSVIDLPWAFHAQGLVRPLVVVLINE